MSVLIFQSHVFSLERPIKNGRQADLPLGEDVAKFLHDGINDLSGAWDAKWTEWEDFGSVVAVHTEDKRFLLTVIWAPLYENRDYWVVQFSQSHGLLGSLLRRRDDQEMLASLRESVHDVVAGSPERCHNVAWLTEEEFNSLY